MLRQAYIWSQKLKLSKKICKKCVSKYGSECGECQLKLEILHLEYQIGEKKIDALALEYFF